VQSERAPLEVAFVGLFAALEFVLTCVRSGRDYNIMPPAEFARFVKDFCAWLRLTPLA
jgi:hypothetical protein